MRKERADVALVRRGLCASRERARAAILAGEVTADGVPVTKAGELVSEDVRLEASPAPRYVSRGGTKLAKALDTFGIDARGMVAVDVGASTGGFTDCLLQRGAEKVVAVDVGYGQLSWSLRNDPRVVVMERTNVRHLAPADVRIKADIITVDVSFISVRKILKPVLGMLKSDGELLVLIKPQFEGRRADVGKKGIVRDASVHSRILSEMARSLGDACLKVLGVTYSPITGADGNIEYWLRAARTGAVGGGGGLEQRIEETVRAAHAALGSSG